MQFHDWQTMFDEFVKSDKSLRKVPLDHLALMEYENIESSPFRIEANRTKRFLRLGIEYSWCAAGKPYYKVHPLMVRKLSKIDLDKIPVEFVEVPCVSDKDDPFRTVCFRFAEDVPIQYTDAHAGVTMVYGKSIEESPIYVRSVLFARVSPNMGQQIKNKLPTDWGHVDFFKEDNFIFVFDEGFRAKQENIERTLCNSIVIGVRKDETISKAIERGINEDSILSKLSCTLKQRLENLFRIIISVGFLANAPEDGLIVLDILNKDKAAYETALKTGDQDRIRVIEERARRRGHNGWNVGTNEIFVGELPLLGGGKTSENGGNELRWSHIRGGHPHAVRFGPGKRKVKIKWFRPTRVRRDLPFKAD